MVRVFIVFVFVRSFRLQRPLQTGALYAANFPATTRALREGSLVPVREIAAVIILRPGDGTINLGLRYGA